MLKDKEKIFVNILITFIFLYLDAVMTNGVFGPLFSVLSYYPLFAAIVLLLIVFIKNEGFTFLINKLNIILGAAIVLVAIPYFIKNDIYLFYICMQLGIFGLVFNIYRYCKIHNTNKENYIIALVVLCNYLVTYVVSTYYMVETGDSLIRFAAHDSKEELVANYGIKATYFLGTPSSAWGALIVSSWCISKIVKKQYKWTLPLIVCLFFFYKSDFLIGLLTFVFVFLIYVFILTKEKLGTKKAALIFGLLFVVCILVIYLMYSLFLLPINIYLRIDGIINKLFKGELDFAWLYKQSELWVKGLDGKGVTNDLEARFVTYFAPIIGIIENKFLYNPFNVLISSHTTVLDLISLLGVLSLLLFYWFFKTFSYILNYIKDKEIYLCIILFFVLNCILNANLTVDNAVLLFFVIPSLDNYEVN